MSSEDEMERTKRASALALLLSSFGIIACAQPGPAGPQGPSGPTGPAGPTGPTGPAGAAGNNYFVKSYALDINNTAVTFNTANSVILQADILVPANSLLHVDAFVSGNTYGAGGTTVYTQIRIVRAGVNAIRARSSQTVTPSGGLGLVSTALHWMETCPIAETVTVTIEGQTSNDTCNVDPMLGGGALVKGIVTLN